MAQQHYHFDTIAGSDFDPSGNDDLPVWSLEDFDDVLPQSGSLNARSINSTRYGNLNDGHQTGWGLP